MVFSAPRPYRPSSLPHPTPPSPQRTSRTTPSALQAPLPSRRHSCPAAPPAPALRPPSTSPSAAAGPAVTRMATRTGTGSGSAVMAASSTASAPPSPHPPPRNQPHPSVQTHLRAISHTYGRTNKNTQTAGAGAGAAAVAHTCHEKGARPQNRTPGRRPRLRKINGSGWVDDCRSEPIRVTCIRVLLSRVQCLRPCLTYTNKHTPV